MLGHTPVCAVEIEPYCRQVLRERQADGTFPPFPVFDDVCKFDGRPWRGIVDVVSGGFPCQPWSPAGKRKGTDDPRHLWPEMARIIDETRPRYVFAENVSINAFAEPWRDLRALGYRVPPALCLSAGDVGAPHLRKRWWLLAVSNTGGTGLQGLRQSPCGTRTEDPVFGNPRWWATEPRVGRVGYGVADRGHRVKALGNGQVPLCAAEAWRILMAQAKRSPLLD